MAPEFWQAVKEFGIPAVYLALTIFAFSKLWKHHLKVTDNLIAEKLAIQSRADDDKKELEKCTKEDKEKLENEVRELYKELVNITSESQRILGEVIPLLKRRNHDEP